MSSNRGLVIAGFAVPASFVYRNVEKFRKRIGGTLRNANAELKKEMHQVPIDLCSILCRPNFAQ